MVVYIFHCDQVYNDQILDNPLRVFSTYEKAREFFKKWRDDEMEYIKRDGWTIDANDEDHFEAYEEGYYTGNHSEGRILEKEVI